ncbi:hypothetical protein VP01_1300g1 [Puccinia sorghi]|uniref:Uncharacterized protein n=1 Tax=Puccinia sorghi TaxID=27349 RepID=A0A0L6VN38_9BASI|nr:hypothetical protein VP01_1300g1 [Puccinia sorghi]
MTENLDVDHKPGSYDFIRQFFFSSLSTNCLNNFNLEASLWGKHHLLRGSLQFYLFIYLFYFFSNWCHCLVRPYKTVEMYQGRTVGQVSFALGHFFSPFLIYSSLSLRECFVHKLSLIFGNLVLSSVDIICNSTTNCLVGYQIFRVIDPVDAEWWLVDYFLHSSNGKHQGHKMVTIADMSYDHFNKKNNSLRMNHIIFLMILHSLLELEYNFKKNWMRKRCISLLLRLASTQLITREIYVRPFECKCHGNSPDDGKLSYLTKTISPVDNISIRVNAHRLNHWGKQDKFIVKASLLLSCNSFSHSRFLDISCFSLLCSHLSPHLESVRFEANLQPNCMRHLLLLFRLALNLNSTSLNHTLKKNFALNKSNPTISRKVLVHILVKIKKSSVNLIDQFLSINTLIFHPINCLLFSPPSHLASLSSFFIINYYFCRMPFSLSFSSSSLMFFDLSLFNLVINLKLMITHPVAQVCLMFCARNLVVILTPSPVGSQKECAHLHHPLTPGDTLQEKSAQRTEGVLLVIYLSTGPNLKNLSSAFFVWSPALQKKLAQLPAVDIQKITGNFCCYSNLSSTVIQPSFDAQPLWSLDDSLKHGSCQLKEVEKCPSDRGLSRKIPCGVLYSGKKNEVSRDLENRRIMTCSLLHFLKFINHKFFLVLNEASMQEIFEQLEPGDRENIMRHYWYLNPGSSRKMFRSMNNEIKKIEVNKYDNIARRGNQNSYNRVFTKEEKDIPCIHPCKPRNWVAVWALFGERDCIGYRCNQQVRMEISQNFFLILNLVEKRTGLLIELAAIISINNFNQLFSNACLLAADFLWNGQEKTGHLGQRGEVLLSFRYKGPSCKFWEKCFKKKTCSTACSLNAEMIQPIFDAHSLISPVIRFLLIGPGDYCTVTVPIYLNMQTGGD